MNHSNLNPIVLFNKSASPLGDRQKYSIKPIDIAKTKILKINLVLTFFINNLAGFYNMLRKIPAQPHFLKTIGMKKYG